MKHGNWIAIDKSLMQALPIKRRYSVIEAVFSYQLDMDNGSIKSENEYSRIWGWSRTKVRNLLKHSRVTHTDTPKTTQRQIKFRFIKPLTINRGRAETEQRLSRDRAETTTIYPNPNPDTKNTCGVKNKLFEQFWNLYPSRNGKKLLKADTGEFFLRKIKDEDISRVLTATQNYANSESVKQGVGIRDAIRFLKKDYWRSWIEPEEKPKKPLDKVDYSEYSCEKCSRKAGEQISHRYSDELFKECLKLRNKKIIKKEQERMTKIEARI